jgi:hypothetical protein
MKPKNKGFYRSGVICQAAELKGKHAIDRDVEHGGCHYGHCFNDWHFYDFDILIQ